MQDVVDLAEAYDRTKQARLQHDRESKKLHEIETALKKHIIELLKEKNMTAAGCATVILTLGRKPQARAGDWDEIHRYIIEHDAWDLVQRRLSEDAVRERMLDGPIPGVTIEWLDTLSESRAKLRGLNDE